MLHFSQKLFDQMIAHASTTPYVEVCGLVSTKRIHPIENAAAHPENSFMLDPVQFIDTYYQIRQSTDETILGIYHSHPNGLAVPSPTDIQQANYPDWIYFIVHNSRISAWHIINGETTLLNLKIIR
jgi:proteasome lid subunit RPN8/RPN11